MRKLFETGLAGVGCFLGLALVLGLLFAPLIPFLAIVAAVWAFAKLTGGVTKETKVRPVNRAAPRTGTEARTHSRVTGEPDHVAAEARTEGADLHVEDTIGARMRSTANAARAVARTHAARTSRALKRYWRKDA